MPAGTSSYFLRDTVESRFVMTTISLHRKEWLRVHFSSHADWQS
jgi:hypothetical protein